MSRQSSGTYRTTAEIGANMAAGSVNECATVAAAEHGLRLHLPPSVNTRVHRLRVHAADLTALYAGSGARLDHEMRNAYDFSVGRRRIEVKGREYRCFEKDTRCGLRFIDSVDFALKSELPTHVAAVPVNMPYLRRIAAAEMHRLVNGVPGTVAVADPVEIRRILFGEHDRELRLAYAVKAGGSITDTILARSMWVPTTVLPGRVVVEYDDQGAMYDRTGRYVYDRWKIKLRLDAGDRFGFGDFVAAVRDNAPIGAVDDVAIAAIVDALRHADGPDAGRVADQLLQDLAGHA